MSPLWTTTKIPNWRRDCEKFFSMQEKFEVRDVLEPGDRQYCLALARSAPGWSVAEKEGTIIFSRDAALHHPPG
jgi:hypothetical protein